MGRVRKGLKEEEGYGEKRIKVYCVGIKIPYVECDYYVYQKCNNKINSKNLIAIEVVVFLKAYVFLSLLYFILLL